MQDGFAEPAINAAHVVFGQRLRPFCAAHLLWLHAAESPLVVEGLPLTAVDLMIAAKACSAPIKMVNGAWIPAVKLRPTIADKWRIARCVNRHYLNRNVRAWRAYLEDYATGPDKATVEGSSPPTLTAPGFFSGVVRMSHTLGEQRAWTMPYGMMLTYIDIGDEAAGAKIKFKSDPREEARILEELRKADEAGKRILEQLAGGVN